MQAPHALDDRSILRTYAHDDVSIGSWMIGLAVKHVNEGKLCCSSWSSGSLLSMILFSVESALYSSFLQILFALVFLLGHSKS